MSPGIVRRPGPKRIGTALRDRARRRLGQQEEPVANRFPLGHYYSPLPDSRELAREPRRSQVWPETPRPTPGVDWNPTEQRRLATDVFARQQRLDFVAQETRDPTVYWTDNDQYPALDAWILEGILRYFRPARMIEIGSGYSSLVSARVNREFLRNTMDLVCIEPHPRDWLQAGVPGISRLRMEEVQDTPFELFEELGDRDVLFIDTAHTVKTGGDVVWIYGEILPRLKPGVVVHIHDAFLPGDYPEEWVLEGWGWNEIYLISAFLAFNSAFEVLFGARWMLQNEPELVERAFPDFRRHRERGGASLWIRRR
jgi:predicted O-methyltransferase YrrM